jgi:uncharacterized protein (DUF934 family)
MLIKRGRIVDDPFFAVGDDEPAPATGAMLVSLKRFAAEKDALLARGYPLAVRVGPGESPESLGADVQKLSAVVLLVGYFKDGRAFSWARLLRTRLGFKGEIRVSGHFLKDQLAFYARVGADAFDFSHNVSPEDVDRAMREISHVYQPAVDGQRTIRELRVKVKAARALAS